MERVGECRYNNTGHRMEIVEYRGATDITVKWDCGNTQTTTYQNFKKGTISYANHKGFAGAGYHGFGKYAMSWPKEGQVLVPKHITKYWRYMLLRVYNKDYLGEAKNVGYLDTIICEDWLNFQNFAEWCFLQKGCGSKDDRGAIFQLDKEILGTCGKEYSPDACVFVPQELNIFFSKKTVGKYGRGVKAVYKNGKLQGYTSNVSELGEERYLGFFSDPEDARLAHYEAKKEVAQLLARKWEGRVDERVVEALQSFELSDIIHK